ncbi:hypothetical protein AMS68_005900 [Peltaster fructicola]|uniref:Large ribosomal subunit protein mL44 n=1 Tax=Peltaster fructicola TaxID=286661 RepID=A0A6H0Y045_9PEZI|nr:hypothetical protein AMS68_005900 [Peltaster fructicola]
MKRVRLDTWVCQLQPPRNPRIQTCHISRPTSRSTRPHDLPQQQWCHRRGYATEVASTVDAAPANDTKKRVSRTKAAPRIKVSVDGTRRIAKLSALHARLALPPKLPLQTLARCLVDASADENPSRNNQALAVLGQDLLAYYTSEYLITHYPRLPLAILFAAQYAYSGPAVLSALRSEWGVETAFSPGDEVDRALLKFMRVTPGKALAEDGISQIQDQISLQRMGLHKEKKQSGGLSRRVIRDDEFGEQIDAKPYQGAPISTSATPVEEISDDVAASAESVQQYAGRPVTTEQASATFIRALTGAVYLHAGDEAVKTFHRDHILSRHLQLHKLFHFNAAPRDLHRLCAREGFEAPIARLLSETGRLSRTPVFVVGIFSGNDKLGEAAGASLNEARFRAAAAALRAWYLYSPPIDSVMLPSDMEAPGAKPWIPQMVDPGEIIS